MKSLLFFLFSIAVLGCFAQNDYLIKYSSEPVSMDGFLDESAWADAEIATDFTKRLPVFGDQSTFKSEIKMIYDDDAVFVAGMLYDNSPDSVNYNLSQRDDFGNADWFAVSIDTYGNKVNAFTFAVTSAGVEADMLESIDGTDGSWNAVWKSAVQKRDFGWSFEIRIPYSALRFPNQDIQNWNVNFFRTVRRNREQSSWNPVDPNVFGEITQAGVLNGVKNIKAPVRLSFTPYATFYLENGYNPISQEQEWGVRATGGLDLKYGLNDAFTLDMTLIPDFGQTTSDNTILNLGPFEVQYDENRPFFIEGTDLFQIGNVFYSRRIGALPYNFEKAYESVNDSLNESVVSSPIVSSMINGTKVSGRTTNGLGVGVFNSVENEMFATLEDSIGRTRRVQTNPFTNYNVLVLSQNLNNNSTVSFVNTNVIRDGSARDANVSVAEADLYTRDGAYNVFGTFKISSVLENGETIFGHNFFSEIQKVSGKWRYGGFYEEESDTYDPNDLGFLYNNNSRTFGAKLEWHDFKSTKRFFRRSAGLYLNYQELYKPQDFISSEINWFIGGMHKKQVYTRISGNFQPFGEFDYFESRTTGKVVKYNPNYNVGWFFTSDYSKVFALDGNFSITQFVGRNQYSPYVYLSPRIRVSDRMNVVFETSYTHKYGDYGYVWGANNSNSDDIYLGVRNMDIIENVISSEFIFTKRMGVDLRLRHYFHQVDYKYFTTLKDDGSIQRNSYNPTDSDGQSIFNTSYNAFTLDVNFRWIFIPGSELRIVYKNNIFRSSNVLNDNYFDVFDDLFDSPQINSVSIKVLVFVDALYFKRKKKIGLE